MHRLDRYILSQITVMFGFFSLVLVGVYWVNQAVRLFDDLLADGQSVGVFLEFSALILPNIMRITLGIAAFAGAVAVAVRLAGDSELAALSATGVSPWRLARPAALFGLLMAVLMGTMTHFLVPNSLKRLEQREAEVSANLAAQLLRQGNFVFPSQGVTFWAGDVDADGRLRSVFISDTRQPGRQVSYSANEAYLIMQEGVPSLVMVNGTAQIYRSAERRLAVTSFLDFSYSLEGLIPEPSIRPHIRHVSTWALITDPEGVMADTDRNRAQLSDELHGRFAEPLFAAGGALLGFALVITAPFRRTGNGRAVGLAVMAMILVKFSESAVTGAIRASPANWPLAYLPAALTIVIAAAILWLATVKRRPLGQPS